MPGARSVWTSEDHLVAARPPGTATFVFTDVKASTVSPCNGVTPPVDGCASLVSSGTSASAAGWKNTISLRFAWEVPCGGDLGEEFSSEPEGGDVTVGITGGEAVTAAFPATLLEVGPGA
jgi:hypothetical protein